MWVCRPQSLCEKRARQHLQSLCEERARQRLQSQCEEGGRLLLNSSYVSRWLEGF